MKMCEFKQKFEGKFKRNGKSSNFIKKITIFDLDLKGNLKRNHQISGKFAMFS